MGLRWVTIGRLVGSPAGGMDFRYATSPGAAHPDRCSSCSALSRPMLNGPLVIAQHKVLPKKSSSCNCRACVLHLPTLPS
ncbi:Protein RTA1 [Fusarium oxysporum f. sp. albedinis]|nr:Protein RTA1 [Fusarium oxysporum f. sp. albedinis]